MIVNFLREEIARAVEAVYPDTLLPHFEALPSQYTGQGDYASNIAMVLGPVVDENPREVAEKIKDALLERETFTEAVEKVEVAGPGFLNITLGLPLLTSGLHELVESLEGGFSFLSGTTQNIEFISVNPTGKLHVGHGRGAFYGDVLANILGYSGGFVTREYYINNSRESKQIGELGKTALGRGEQYKTSALEEKLEGLEFEGLSEEEAGFKLAEVIQEENQLFIEENLGVFFDTWYSEDESLRVLGKVEEMRKRLEEKGVTYESDGATWLKTSAYGDDEDRVIVRSDGKSTYFLADIAYHADKFSRGLDTVFNIWGAEHQGHVKRMQAAKKMLQWQGVFHIFVVQLVMLKDNGERVKMSKRAGNVVLLEDLVEELGLDVVRWFFLERALSTQMDFNLDLARETSEKNPVRYVQYAHARMCSILIKATSPSPQVQSAQMPSKILENASARSLALKLIQFSEVIEEIAEDYAVNKLTTYTYELAQNFSQFYRDVRVIGESGEVNTEALGMVERAQRTLAKCLNLLGISAPEKM